MTLDLVGRLIVQADARIRMTLDLVGRLVVQADAGIGVAFDLGLLVALLVRHCSSFEVLCASVSALSIL
jgi:hypothetical protein